MLKMDEVDEEFIPLKYKLNEGSVERTMFMKKHAGNDDFKPCDRTLYVVNIPQFLIKKCLKELFTSFGDVERIYIQSKPSSGKILSPKSKYFSPTVSTLGPKVGYIIFKRPASLRKALKFRGVPIVTTNAFDMKVGTKKWIHDYNSQFIDSEELYNEVKSFMSEFDQKCEDEKLKAKEAESVDEDGWVTVTKHSKKPKIPRTEIANKRLIEKQNRAQAKQTLVNFYKCQLRNAKMDQIAELRKKFESDKKRLALMKMNRKFKPI